MSFFHGLEVNLDYASKSLILLSDKEVGKKLVTDAMFRLQHDVDDKGKSKATNPSLTRLEDHKEKWRDDYTTNQLLRQKFRVIISFTFWTYGSFMCCAVVCARSSKKSVCLRFNVM